ncbi:MAG: hypothetical protein K2Q18_05125, partial [Bdellovibrionales bacterium]|nr:hypothetical protein [Bdellovibrionales bacterium]
MKNAISFILIFLCLILVAWWSKTPSGHLITASLDAKSPEVILKNDFEKITRNLNPKNIENAEWVQINNYALKAEDIVSKGNAKDYFVISKKIMALIITIINKDKIFHKLVL